MASKFGYRSCGPEAVVPVVEGGAMHKDRIVHVADISGMGMP
jgi:hypothetical protein